jgi:hypothetical protein
MDNLFAWTAPGSNYPPFVSINRKGDEIYVTVRATPPTKGACGDTITVLTPADAWKETSFAGTAPQEAPAMPTREIKSEIHEAVYACAYLKATISETVERILALLPKPSPPEAQAETVTR